MKTLLVVFLTLLSTTLLANDRTVEYWCNPSERMKGLEAVIVSNIDNETFLEIYTESRRWGSVDQKLEKANLTISSNHEFLSENNNVSLEIYTGGNRPSTPMQFFQAKFVDTTLGIDMRMFCEYLP